MQHKVCDNHDQGDDEDWVETETSYPGVVEVEESSEINEEKSTAEDDNGQRANHQCRICFGGVEDEIELGRLISPCLCSGTMRFAHVKCLDAWRGSGTNTKAYLECQQCRHQYHLQRTRISGLATSRPVLALCTLILFTAIALAAGHFLHWILLASPSVSTKMLRPDPDTDLIVIGGGAWTYDIIVGSIRAVVDVAHESGVDVELSSSTSLAGWFLTRILLGLSLLGSISFISLIFSLSLFGPVQLAHGFRGAGLFGNFRRVRRTTERTEGNAGQMVIILFVIIGVVNTLVKVYGMLQGYTMRLLLVLETKILEVNPEERRRARLDREHNRLKGHVGGWFRIWFRSGRWKRWAGWKELIARARIGGIFGYRH